MNDKDRLKMFFIEFINLIKIFYILFDAGNFRRNL